MTEREALKLALEALERGVKDGYWNKDTVDASTRIKEVLAQPEPSELDVWKSRALQAEAVVEKFMAQPKQEPVAWETFALKFANGKGLSYEKPTNLPKYLGCRPLYPPPQRTWVVLTDEEIDTLLKSGDVAEHDAWNGRWYVLPYSLTRAIEAKLKQKNGYAEEKNT